MTDIERVVTTLKLRVWRTKYWQSVFYICNLKRCSEKDEKYISAYTILLFSISVTQKKMLKEIKSLQSKLKGNATI